MEGPDETGAGDAGGPRRAPDARAYWRANLRLIAILLAIWALVSYGFGIVLVEPLNRFHLGGFPLGFWFAQQGSIYVFVVLILVYAVAMDRIDRCYGVDDSKGEARAARRSRAESTSGGAP